MPTWNTDKPALANQIADDIPDIEENLQELHDVVEAITNGTLGTTAAANFSVDKIVNTASDTRFYGLAERSIFTYNGGATAYTIKLKGAAYYCKEKYCYWASELTSTAIGTPGASDWYYLYLDYSAITSGTAITNSELIWSNTEPAWSDTYRGWYNSDDRCIFAARTNAGPTNIVEFIHNNDFVHYADYIADLTTTDIDNSWTDVTLTMPKFSTVALIFVRQTTHDTSTQFYWRTNGQTGATGHWLIEPSAVGQGSRSARVVTDASQVIEVQTNAAGNDAYTITTDGWQLPIGL